MSSRPASLRSRTLVLLTSFPFLLPRGIQRPQPLLQPVVAHGHAVLHRGLEDGVAGFARLVEDREREGGGPTLLVEDVRYQRLARVPGFMELFDCDESLWGHDFAMDASCPISVPFGPRHTKR